MHVLRVGRNFVPPYDESGRLSSAVLLPDPSGPPLASLFPRRKSGIAPMAIKNPSRLLAARGTVARGR